MTASCPFWVWRGAICALVSGLLVAACGANAHIRPADVNLSNVVQFETEVRMGLPIGTSKEAVEAYLTHAGLSHWFADREYVPGGNTFFASIKNIGIGAVPPGMPVWETLEVHIHLGNDDRVESIEFSIIADAP